MRNLGLLDVVLGIVFVSLTSTTLYAATEQVSLLSDGTQPNDNSGLMNNNFRPNMISANNRYVVFESKASNIVSDDTNGFQDVFIHDMELKTTELISRNSNNDIGDGYSRCATISGDGTIVAFHSIANNLDVPDVGSPDIFIRDLTNDITKKISNGYDGAAANSTSYYPSLGYSGRFVTFMSSASNLVPGDTEGKQDIFLYDRVLNVMERVSAVNGVGGNASCIMSVISANERFVAFYSSASNLVGSDTNGFSDMFVFDRLTKNIERVSIAADGSQANGDSGTRGFSISGDGRYVAFASDATNLVSDDTNNATDIFVYDRELNVTERVALNSITPSINSDGRFVSYVSSGVYIIDRQNGSTYLASEIGATHGVISSDGRNVLYNKKASNYIYNDYLWTSDTCP